MHYGILSLIGGKREKFMNLEYNDFKANFPGLGKPADVCHRWLTEMTKEDSHYLPYKISLNNQNNILPNENPSYGCTSNNYNTHSLIDDSQYIVSHSTKKDHFAGLKFSVWNNRAFTVHFTW